MAPWQQGEVMKKSQLKGEQIVRILQEVDQDSIAAVVQWNGMGETSI